MSEFVTEPPIVFVPKLRAPDGTLHPMEEPFPGWQQAMHQRVLNDRAALLAHLQHDETGVDVASAANHLEELGMKLNPYCVVTNSSDRTAQQALAKHDAILGVSQGGPTPVNKAAYFLAQLGLSLIDRPSGSNPYEIQVSLVHEGAHANGITEVTVECDESGASVGEQTTTKRGFRSRDRAGRWRGKLGEESFAILTHGGYVQANHAQGTPYACEPQRILHTGYIHPKYLSEGNLRYQYTFGALALEVLGAYDPGLAPALIEARKSQRGIDTMVARLEKISRGLGQRMIDAKSVGIGRVIPDDGSFFLRHALQATYTTLGEVMDICEDGPMSQYFSGAVRHNVSGPSSTPEISPVRERIEVRPAFALDEDEITRVLREVADTMRDEGNMS